jgi:hypothetical protein
VRVVAAAGLVAEPWRNGGGITREISAHSDAAGLVWRLSLAKIDRDGPFSAFPGLRRILTVVDGDGLVLDLGARRLSAQPLQPVAFDGGATVTARLAGGPVRVLNVIWRPAAVAAAVRLWRGGAPGGDSPAPGPAPAALHVLAGSCRLADGTLLAAGDSAIDPLPVVALGAGALMVAVRLDPPGACPAP